MSKIKNNPACASCGRRRMEFHDGGRYGTDYMKIARRILPTTGVCEECQIEKDKRESKKELPS